MCIRLRNWSKTYFHLRSDFKWLQVNSIYGLSLSVQAWVDSSIWKTWNITCQQTFNAPTMCPVPSNLCQFESTWTFLLPMKVWVANHHPLFLPNCVTKGGFLTNAMKALATKITRWGSVRTKLVCDFRRGILWLALTDITMRTVIVLAWEKPLITKKDKSVWNENQKLNESPSSVMFGGLMICRFWKKWPILCLLKQGGMQDGRRTGGKCVQQGRREHWLQKIDILWIRFGATMKGKYVRQNGSFVSCVLLGCNYKLVKRSWLRWW